MTNFEQGNRSDFLIEVYGTEGVLLLPDPMGYEGKVQLRKIGQQDWTTLCVPAFQNPQRHGLGLVDMVEAIREHRSPRANGALATHVIDSIRLIQDSARLGKPLQITISKGDF